MAKCEYCGREMLEADGCKCCEIEVDGKWLPRIRFGHPYDLSFDHMCSLSGEQKLQQRCHDCNVKYGEFHHPGCDGEACPKCKMQLLMCTCDVGKLAWYE